MDEGEYEAMWEEGAMLAARSDFEKSIVAPECHPECHQGSHHADCEWYDYIYKEAMGS